MRGLREPRLTPWYIRSHHTPDMCASKTHTLTNVHTLKTVKCCEPASIIPSQPSGRSPYHRWDRKMDQLPPGHPSIYLPAQLHSLPFSSLARAGLKAEECASTMSSLARDPPSLRPFETPMPTSHHPTSLAIRHPALLLPTPLPDLPPPHRSASSLPSPQPDARRPSLH